VHSNSIRANYKTFYAAAVKNLIILNTIYKRQSHSKFHRIRDILVVQSSKKNPVNAQSMFSELSGGKRVHLTSEIIQY
jgi:hypothetical protein